MAKVKGTEKLPKGWKRVRFKDYVYFQEGPGLTSDLFRGKDEGIPFLNIRCIQENKILREKLQYLNGEIVKKRFKHFLLEENDLVVSSSGTLGRCIFIKKEDLPLLLNTSIIRLRPLNRSLNRLYLKYYVESTHFQKEIYRLSTGSAQSNYGPSHLKGIYLNLPPLPEQRKIAEILETVDNAIEKTDRIIEKYKRIKQGLMQDLLNRGIDENGNIRSEKTHRFKDSPLGRIPEEWEVVRLGEIAKIKTGESNAEDAVDDGEYPLFDRSLEIKRSNRYLFDKEAVIVPGEGADFKPKYYKGKFDLHQRAYAIFDLNGINGKFLYYIMFKAKADLIRFSVGTTVISLRLPHFQNLKIPLPPLPEQHRIASILSQIDETIEKEQKYKEKLERIKRGLMEDLLTGKVRVNNLIEGGK